MGHNENLITHGVLDAVDGEENAKKESAAKLEWKLTIDTDGGVTSQIILVDWDALGRFFGEPYEGRSEKPDQDELIHETLKADPDAPSWVKETD